MRRFIWHLLRTVNGALGVPRNYRRRLLRILVAPSVTANPSRQAGLRVSSILAMESREQLCGVVDRVGMAMNDLPLAVLPPEDCRTREHVRNRFGAGYRRGRTFDREQICEVLAHVGGDHFPLARAAVREARRQLLEHGTDVGPPDRTESSSEDGHGIGMRPHLEARTGVAVMERCLGLVDAWHHLVEEPSGVTHGTSSVTFG